MLKLNNMNNRVVANNKGYMLIAIFMCTTKCLALIRSSAVR